MTLVKRNYPEGVYENLIELESLYLRLLIGRLEEIESAQQMAAFMQIYRLSRLGLGSKYEKTTLLRLQKDTMKAAKNILFIPSLITRKMTDW